MSDPEWVVNFTLDVSKGVRALAMVGGAISASLMAYFIGYKLANHNQEEFMMRETEDNERVQEIVGRLMLNDDTLREVMSIVDEEMIKAQTTDHRYPSELKMIPSYVHQLPRQNIAGRYLVLDLGGTNFRIAEVTLQEDGNNEEKSKVFILSDRLLIDEGTELFRYVANCLTSFMRLRNLAYRKNKLPLAFCFSFPCSYASINKATLIHWAKGFNCKNTCGRDIGEMLQNSIDERKEIGAKVVAVVNDTVSCMMSCAYRNKNCYIGAIFGSGINACYMEDTSKLKFLPAEVVEKHSKVAVNIEWGGLGHLNSLEFIRTQYDFEIDKLSNNPGHQIFEKMVSALYLGDIAWTIIQELINQDLLFRGVMNKNQRNAGYMQSLVKRGTLTAKKLSEIEMDIGVKFKTTRALLAELGLRGASFDDCSVVKHVCELVSKRAANLAGAVLASLINHIRQPHIVIGVDGSLYRHHLKFRENMEMMVSRLVDRDLTYRIVLNEEGSAKGAAIVAAMQEDQE